MMIQLWHMTDPTYRSSDWDADITEMNPALWIQHIEGPAYDEKKCKHFQADIIGTMMDYGGEQKPWTLWLI